VASGMLRLVDLLAGLSRVADLGYGLHAGESLRASALAAMLARVRDLPADDVRAAMYTGLLLHVGCVGYAHETARRFGDEYDVQLGGEMTNLASRRDVAGTLVPALTKGRLLGEQARVAGFLLTRGLRFGRSFDTASCEVGRDAARRLHLPQAVQRGVYHSSEWWNGKGAPAGLAGEDIPPAARVALLSHTAVLFDTLGGRDLAVEAVRQRRGGILDPSLVDHFSRRAEPLLGELDATDPLSLVRAEEPQPAVMLPTADLARVAAVFGDLADLKTPYTHGHSRGVAALARDAGARLGLDAANVADLGLAAHLHDVGRVAISNTVWEKRGSLGAHEWEQVRLHAYHSERIVAASEPLAGLAPLVGMHHERCDGSGYHRGCSQAEQPPAARVLAAADAYQAMTQARPHREAHPAEQAEQRLRAEGATGRLDADAVTAVLAAAGHDVVVRRELPGGLTEREVEVLALVAEGCTNAEVAKRLVISRRTAEQHMQNVYAKLGVSSRAAAALFAMEHHLLPRKDQ
jgi:HD-GYP domain-containing protein (c-di-GMP phosphodiesterase class II)